MTKYTEEYLNEKFGEGMWGLNKNDTISLFSLGFGKSGFKDSKKISVKEFEEFKNEIIDGNRITKY